MNVHSNSQTRAMDFERNTVGRYSLCTKPCPVWKLLPLFLHFPISETHQLKQKIPEHKNNHKKPKEEREILLGNIRSYGIGMLQLLLLPKYVLQNTFKLTSDMVTKCSLAVNIPVRCFYQVANSEVLLSFLLLDFWGFFCLHITNRSAQSAPFD